VATFLLTRLRDGVVVLLLVTVVIFVLGHMIGNVASVMAPPDATDEQIAQIAHQLGLDRPFHEQFISYFGGLLRGDFGESPWQKRPALTVVLEALPATIILTGAGIVVAALLGAVFGILAGAHPSSLLDRVANFLSVVALSVPSFWLALLLIVIVAVGLRLLPTSGFTGWQSLILPAITLGLAHGGRIFQLVRSATFEELTKPYVLVARSKGLPDRIVLWRHIFQNIAVTVATTVGWEYARMMGGVVFAIEVVYAWPGVGQLMITAASRRDFPVLQAAVIVTGAFVILANLIVDLVYRLVDRRLAAA
jgi:peptide/nickel transport system permease protein